MPEAKLSNHQTIRLEFAKLKVERAKARAEVIKWIAIAIGAVVSFVIIDYGKLRLESVRVASDNQFRFIDAYSQAVEAPEPDVWKRKLEALELVGDDRFQDWLKKQRAFINDFAALEALYRETLKTASQLIGPTIVNDPERMKARRRFDQLYWADLPFAGESQEVEAVMVKFREGLMAAEKTPVEMEAWEKLNGLLLELSATLKSATRKASRRDRSESNSKAE